MLVQVVFGKLHTFYSGGHCGEACQLQTMFPSRSIECAVGSASAYLRYWEVIDSESVVSSKFVSF